MNYEDPIEYQIALILQAAGIGSFKVDIFVSKEPDSPDNCVTVYSTGGLPDDCLEPDERSSEIPNFQVRVRNADYAAGHAVMEAIRAVLNKRKNTVTDSGGAVRITTWLTTLPHNIRRDTKNRPIRVANFSAMRALV